MRMRLEQVLQQDALAAAQIDDRAIAPKSWARANAAARATAIRAGDSGEKRRSRLTSGNTGNLDDLIWRRERESFRSIR
jgi:hypothetical protein